MLPYRQCTRQDTLEDASFAHLVTVSHRFRHGISDLPLFFAFLLKFLDTIHQIVLVRHVCRAQRALCIQLLLQSGQLVTPFSAIKLLVETLNPITDPHTHVFWQCSTPVSQISRQFASTHVLLLRVM